MYQKQLLSLGFAIVTSFFYFYLSHVLVCLCSCLISRISLRRLLIISAALIAGAALSLILMI